MPSVLLQLDCTEACRVELAVPPFAGRHAAPDRMQQLTHANKEVDYKFLARALASRVLFEAPTLVRREKILFFRLDELETRHSRLELRCKSGQRREKIQQLPPVLRERGLHR